jgi:hypothetical protein
VRLQASAADPLEGDAGAEVVEEAFEGAPVDVYR